MLVITIRTFAKMQKEHFNYACIFLSLSQSLVCFSLFITMLPIVFGAVQLTCLVVDPAPCRTTDYEYTIYSVESTFSR